MLFAARAVARVGDGRCSALQGEQKKKKKPHHVSGAKAATTKKGVHGAPYLQDSVITAIFEECAPGCHTNQNGLLTLGG